jgi:competence protein ComEC
VTLLAARVLVGSAGFVDWMRALAPRVPAPAWWVVCLYACAGAAIAAAHWALLPGRWRARLPIVGRVAMLVAGFWIVFHPGTWRWPWRADGRLHVVSLDVGQGDATLVRLPDGTAVLVDAGGLGTESRFDIGARVVAPSLWALGIGWLDGLLLTHGDPDHIGGAPTIIDTFRPRHVWEGIAVPSHAPMARLRDLARADGLAWTTLRAGSAWARAGVTFQVWNPPAPDWERPRVRNDDSVVLDVRYGDVSVILPGDVSADVERAIAPRIPPARLRVLKLAHHGSATSTSAAFLDALHPTLAIVSCGRDNPFGHPAPAVLARLATRRIPVVRTDVDGEVEVVTDGRNTKVRRVVER